MPAPAARPPLSQRNPQHGSQEEVPKNVSTRSTPPQHAPRGESCDRTRPVQDPARGDRREAEEGREEAAQLPPRHVLQGSGEHPGPGENHQEDRLPVRVTAVRPPDPRTPPDARLALSAI